MRTSSILSVVFFTACAGQRSTPRSAYEPVSCGGSETAIYTPRFTAQYGTSGVASGADAAAGSLNSADPSASVPAADPDLTPMLVMCGSSSCGDGQVEVDIPAPTGGAAGGGAISGIDSTGPTVGAPPTTTTTNSQATVICADPPPYCTGGLAPQYDDVKKQWECADCTLVVTYGGIYGNERRCTSLPDVACPEGQVPTWVYEDDQWECDPTCDNSQYDQHVIAGETVCVPC
jgi:hypothetical protein